MILAPHSRVRGWRQNKQPWQREPVQSQENQAGLLQDVDKPACLTIKSEDKKQIG